MEAHNPADRADPGDEVWDWLERRYREHRSQLYHFALGVLGNREDAEDATQIALLNAHRALVRGERPSRPRAWLFAIALNVCRRLLRARARRAPAVVTREFHPPERGADAPTGAEISLAVASLPEGQREIFLLRELQGLSYAELTERLGLSTAAAESLLARARRRLREQLTVPGEIPDLAPRRRPLLGIPGVYAALRVVRGPAALKLAGVVGAAAIAPGVVIGLHVGPERSPQPVSPAAARAVVQRATPSRLRTRTRPARRESARPAPIAPTAARPAPRAVPVAAPTPRPGPDQPSPAAAEGAEAAPDQPPAVRTVQVDVTPPAAAAVKPPRAVAPPAAESLDTSEPAAAPVPDTGLEVVDEAVATTQDAVDGLPPVSPAPAVPSPPAPAVPTPPAPAVPTPPAPAVPTPPALDPVQDALPDPLPVSSK
jgi:RNA polymerase sigma factor (sigma-70 family)